MTCEIIVANRLGVALAADSAVTYSRNDGNQTFSSGANKIFQLASTRPVAAMIYNNANLESIPWEIIIKEYRSCLSSNGFNQLSEYKKNIIDFLNNNIQLIPNNIREKLTLSAYYQIINKIITTAHQEIKNNNNNNKEKITEAWKVEIQKVKEYLEKEEIDETLDKKEIEEQKEKNKDRLINDTKEYIETNHSLLIDSINYEEFIDLVIDTAFTGVTKKAHNYTGLVISGYGDNEYLPSYHSIKIHGFIGKKLLWEKDGDQAINYGAASSFIQPFAQSNMVNTFTLGASPEAWRDAQHFFTKYSTDACRQAATQAGVSIPEEAIAAAVSNSLKSFTNDWGYATFNAHMRPLRDVVSGLAVPELAELAENLVMLESLKEKVTSRTQSVGGPIDVAVITRSEGLVWIRRKLHFQPELNQRYLMRLQTQYGAN